MIKRTDEEIEEFITANIEIYEYDKFECDISRNKDGSIKIDMSRMYEHLKFKTNNLQFLIALAGFFGTTNINDTRYNWDGCETCDYGSKYGTVLTIRD